MVNEKILYIVTISFAFTWLPVQLFGSKAEAYSLIRLVGVPFIIISILSEYKSYSVVIKNKYIQFFLISILVGMGAGLILGQLSSTILINIFPNVLALLFYARKMNIYQIKKIIIILLFGSLSVCILVIMAYHGVINPVVNTEAQITNLGILFKRTWGGLSSSHIGPWVFLLVSFSTINSLLRIKYLILNLFILSIAYLASIYSAQRSLIFCIILSVILCSLLFSIRIKGLGHYRAKKKYFRNFLTTILAIVIAGNAIYFATHQSFMVLKYRIEKTFIEEDYYGGEQRLIIWKYFLEDLTKNPKFFGSDDVIMEEKVGTGTHILIGEAYYYGGILLLISSILIIISSTRGLIERIKKLDSPIEVEIIFALTATLIASIVYFLVMPGLFSRLFYIIIGIIQGQMYREIPLKKSGSNRNGVLA